MPNLTATRSIVLAVLGMIVLTMLLMMTQGAMRDPNPGVIGIIFLPPLVAIGVSLIPLKREERVVGFWLTAALMVPTAALGIFGGWGLLYFVGIIFLLWAA